MTAVVQALISEFQKSYLQLVKAIETLISSSVLVSDRGVGANILNSNDQKRRYK